MKKNSCKFDSNEENNSINGSDSFDNSLSTAIISRDSNGSSKPNSSNIIQNYFKKNNNGFLGEKNKPEENDIYKDDDDQNNPLILQIKYALRKMSMQYANNKKSFNNFSCCKNNFCEYYLSNINNDSNDGNIMENQNIININRINNYYNKFSINN